MKNYDETVDTVFDRIRDYNVKKKRRTVLACRITAACCAVSLLGGSVWYLNRPTHDIPVTLAPDKNEVTTTTTANTTTDTKDTTTDGGVVTPTTTAPAPSKPTATQAPTTGKTEPPKTTTTTTEVKDKLVITADEPEDFSSDNPHAPLKEQGPISPALQEKMKQYSGADVVYSVIVEALMTGEENEVWYQIPNTNDELIQLFNEQHVAYNAYIQAIEQAGGKYTPEVVEKYDAFKNLNSQYHRMCDVLQSEYRDQCLNRRLKELSDLSKEPLISITTDTRYWAIRTNDPNYVFFMELTAAEINDLAERGGYFIRLVFPGGDKIEEDKPM